MKKPLFAAALLAGCAMLAFGQAAGRPVLGILPFTGGTGDDGEAIATLISMQPEILGAFTVVPRTAALNAIFAEHYFQLAGLTDSDTIAGIGRMLNADYVLSGSIRQLGDRNLFIATIVNVETFEQVGGYHRTYLTVEEVPDFLPSMSRTLVDATLGRDVSGLPSLAMLPFSMATGVDPLDAETLSMILAIEILNTGAYVVLPRTSTIQAALSEIDFQMLGYTDDVGMAALGRAINADLVLSGGIHRLGALNMFTAQVLRVADGSVVSGASRNYNVIADGVGIMAELAARLTGGDVRADVAVAAPLGRTPRQPREPRVPREPRQPRERRERIDGEIPTNWISGEISVLGFGFRYDRNLNESFSLGASFFFNDVGDIVVIREGEQVIARGLVVTARFFPLATGNFSLLRPFYIELGAGWGNAIREGYGTIWVDHWNRYERYWSRREGLGFMLAPAAGWRIDVGRPGGFFINPFVSFPITIGNITGYEPFIRDDGGIDSRPSSGGAVHHIRFGIGIGGAF